jgi:multiple sugar transport system substrate-binding protein
MENERKKLTRRDFLKGLTLSGAGLAIAACSAPAAAPAPAPAVEEPTAAPAAEEPTAEVPAAAEAPAAAGGTMVFWPEWGGKDADALQAQVDAWAADNNITSEFLPIRDHARMIASMSAGDPPDLLMTWDANSVGSWGFEGVLKDLGPYIDQSGMDLAMYFPIGVASGNLMGIKQIGLPLTNYITTILYWNQKVFEDAGLDPTKAPETWDEMWDVSQKLTVVEDGQIKRMGFAPLQDQGGHPAIYAYAFGGSIWSADFREVTPDSEANIEGLKFVRQYYATYGTEEMQRWTSSVGTEADSPTYPIYTGEQGMSINGEWMPSYFSRMEGEDIKMDGGYLPHPAAKPDVAGTMGANTNPMVIPTAAKNPDAAFSFIQYISMPEHSSEMCLTVGNASPVVEGLKLQIQQTPEPLYKQILEEIWAQGNIKPMTINSPVGALYSDTYTRYRDEVVQDGADAVERMTACKEEVQPELDAALEKLGL